MLSHLYPIIGRNIGYSDEFHVVLVGYGFGDAFADDSEPVNADSNLFTGHNLLGPYLLRMDAFRLIAMTSLSIRSRPEDRVDEALIVEVSTFKRCRVSPLQPSEMEGLKDG